MCPSVEILLRDLLRHFKSLPLINTMEFTSIFLTDFCNNSIRSITEIFHREEDIKKFREFKSAADALKERVGYQREAICFIYTPGDLKVLFIRYDDYIRYPYDPVRMIDRRLPFS